ncbi:hypothetical protein ACQBAR_00965 [Propionibacteriaceae bacterium Y1685]
MTGTGRGVLRTLGWCGLGVVGGLLLAVIVQDLLARLLINGPGAAGLTTIGIGAVIPVCVIGGVVVALWVARRG